MIEHGGYVPIKLYLQKQAGGQVGNSGCGLPTPELDHGMEPNCTGFGNQQGIREH
jgi:hypothetical protein